MPNGNITSDLTGSGRMTATLTVPQAGTKNYDDLINKPSINNVTLEGNLNTEDLNISYDDLNDKPVIPEPYTPINYSTSEQNTGIKWIDGKDIYVVTIYNNNIGYTQSGADLIIGTLSNVDKLLFINGLMTNSSKTFKYYLPYIDISGTGKATLSYDIGTGNIIFKANQTWPTAEINVTLFYTKN